MIDDTGMKHGQQRLGEECVGEVVMYHARAAVHMRDRRSD